MEQSPPTSQSQATPVRFSLTLNKQESRAYIVCIFAALTFLGLTLHDVYRQRQLDKDAAEKAVLAMVVPVKASVLLNRRTQFRGDSSAPFTLVEFGDYECPPCRAVQKLLPTALAKYGHRLRLDFRQYPLTQLHPHAESAALAAEAGYLNNKRWVLHDRLFASDYKDRNAVNKCIAQTHVVLNKTLARIQLDADIALANQIGVTGTPSFALCCPDGQVFLLRSFLDIDSILKRYNAVPVGLVSNPKSVAAQSNIPKCGENGSAGCVP